ncbi:MAG: response regulator [Acidobacteria bacterium]|nr:response regulator [Acidobacteriota bacterium]
MMAAPARVLLISESRITRRVVEMTFADQQVDLTTAGTGQEGLAAWDDTPADVVLADLTMDAAPGGFALARHIHQHASGRPVAVLLLAGQHDVVDEAEVAAAGVKAVLRKPLDSLQLIEAVCEATRAGRAAQAPWASPVASPPADEPGTPPSSEEASITSPSAVEAPVLDAAADARPGDGLRDEDVEKVAARVAAIWSGDTERERRVTALLAERTQQAAAASAAAAAERVAPAATSEAAERLVRELAPALVAEVARLVVADVSERLVREEIARMRSAPAAR